MEPSTAPTTCFGYCHVEGASLDPPFRQKGPSWLINGLGPSIPTQLAPETLGRPESQRTKSRALGHAPKWEELKRPPPPRVLTPPTLLETEGNLS